MLGTVAGARRPHRSRAMRLASRQRACRSPPAPASSSAGWAGRPLRGATPLRQSAPANCAFRSTLEPHTVVARACRPALAGDRVVVLWRDPAKRCRPSKRRSGVDAGCSRSPREAGSVPCATSTGSPQAAVPGGVEPRAFLCSATSRSRCSVPSRWRDSCRRSQTTCRNRSRLMRGLDRRDDADGADGRQPGEGARGPPRRPRLPRLGGRRSRLRRGDAMEDPAEREREGARRGFRRCRSSTTTRSSGWVKPFGRRFSLIALRSDAEHPEIAARFKVSLDIARDAGVEVREVTVAGREPLATPVSLSRSATSRTVYVGLRRGADPTPVAVIEGLEGLPGGRTADERGSTGLPGRLGRLAAPRSCARSLWPAACRDRPGLGSAPRLPMRSRARHPDADLPGFPSAGSRATRASSPWGARGCPHRRVPGTVPLMRGTT